MADKINPTIQNFAKLVQEAYKKRRSRTFTMASNSHIYRPEKSTELWCWYEDENVILIGIHGVNSRETGLLAVRQFFNPDKLEEPIEEFCEVHKELTQTDKDVFIAAHSLGAWILASCQERNGNEDIDGIMFAPYAPSTKGNKIDVMASSSRLKKIFYDNDMVSSNLLKVDNLTNTIILTPRTIPSTFINSHTIDNFADSNLELINIDIKEFRRAGKTENHDVIGNILSSRPKELKNFMKLKGKMKMKKFEICKAPINEVYGKITNFLSGGKLAESQKKFNYDSIFHLYLIITFENGEKFSVEKTQVVFVSNFEEDREGEKRITEVNSNKTFTEVIEDLELNMGDNLYRYDATKYNCQNFLMNFVNNVGIKQFDDFIYQNVDGVFSPGLKNFFGFLTDLGGFFQRITEVFSPSIRLDASISQHEATKGNVTLNIMSYNLKMLSSIILKLRQSARAEWIPDEIMARHPEIEVLVVQELFDEPAETVLDKGMKRNGFKYISKKVGGSFGKIQTFTDATSDINFKDPGKSKIEDGGVKIYSKYPIVNEKEVIYSEGVKEDVIARKGAVRITIIKDGVRINVIGTHLQSGRIESAKEIKKIQFVELMSLTKHIENEPIFIFGDFNLDYYDLRDLLEELLKKHNLRIMGTPVGFTSNTDFGKNNENWLDYGLTPINDNIQIGGGIQKVEVRRDAGYTYKKDPKVWDFGGQWDRFYNDTQNRINNFDNELSKIGDAILGVFRTKKQRKKARKRHRRNKQKIEEKKEKAEKKIFGTAHDLSDHHPIKIQITIKFGKKQIPFEPKNPVKRQFQKPITRMPNIKNKTPFKSKNPVKRQFQKPITRMPNIKNN